MSVGNGHHWYKYSALAILECCALNRNDAVGLVMVVTDIDHGGVTPERCPSEY